MYVTRLYRQTTIAQTICVTCISHWRDLGCYLQSIFNYISMRSIRWWCVF